MSTTSVKSAEIPTVHYQPNDRGSVTQWISEVRLGKSVAAENLWQRYSERLLRLAGKRISGAGIVVADEHDVVNDALGVFLMRIRDGAYDELKDREGLWKLLATITMNKAAMLVRDETREKRDVRKVQHGNESGHPLDNLSRPSEPTPDATVLFAESINQFLAELDDVELQEIALAKMEGCTNAEVADRIGRSMATVERRVKLVRKTMQKLISTDGNC